MPTFRLPLSGDVTQTINPWTWLFRTVGNQFGLININLGKSSDPELEARILEDVGSYGRQLGQLGDAMAVLIRYVNPQNIPPEDQRALDALHFQLEEIKRLKDKRRE